MFGFTDWREDFSLSAGLLFSVWPVRGETRPIILGLFI
jgi:hypothetical protein